MGWAFPAEVMNLRDKGRRQEGLEHSGNSELVWTLKSSEETSEKSVEREKLPEDSRASCLESALRGQWGGDLIREGLSEGPWAHCGGGGLEGEDVEEMRSHGYSRTIFATYYPQNMMFIWHSI